MMIKCQDVPVIVTEGRLRPSKLLSDRAIRSGLQISGAHEAEAKVVCFFLLTSSDNPDFAAQLC